VLGPGWEDTASITKRLTPDSGDTGKTPHPHREPPATKALSVSGHGKGAVPHTR